MSETCCREEAGSWRGYLRHRRAGEAACGPCAKAASTRRAAEREHARAATVPELLRRKPELGRTRWLIGVDLLRGITENA